MTGYGREIKAVEELHSGHEGSFATTMHEVDSHLNVNNIAIEIRSISVAPSINMSIRLVRFPFE